MTTISAKIIKDSISPHGIRLTTLELRYPRWIHAEFMTHRVFSRNASSSRAIPVERLIKDVRDDPARPLFWGANQRGMQAGAETNAAITIDERCGNGVRSIDRETAWLEAMEMAIEYAQAFTKAGYHKSLPNRLLEPFAHINVVVSSTDWENFFALRNHEAAEPHIRMLASEMRAAMNASLPNPLDEGDWHLPYVDGDVLDSGDERLADALRLSVARCASVSYKTVDGLEMTQERAASIYEKLIRSSPIHASPAEHQGTPTRDGSPETTGNFRGWLQFRKMLKDEAVRG